MKAADIRYVKINRSASLNAHKLADDLPRERPPYWSVRQSVLNAICFRFPLRCVSRSLGHPYADVIGTATSIPKGSCRCYRHRGPSPRPCRNGRAHPDRFANLLGFSLKPFAPIAIPCGIPRKRGPAPLFQRQISPKRIVAVITIAAACFFPNHYDFIVAGLVDIVEIDEKAEDFVRFER